MARNAKWMREDLAHPHRPFAGVPFLAGAGDHSSSKTYVVTMSYTNSVNPSPSASL